MEHLAARPRIRSVDPHGYPPFATFSCGGSKDYEREVEDLIGCLYREEIEWLGEVRVAEDATGTLIGFCWTHPRSFFGESDAAYVALIGISEPFRRHRLPDGTRIGALLLQDGLERIKRRWGGPPMPPVWALIHPENLASHNLFANFGFEFAPQNPPGYDIRYRARGLGLTPSREADAQP